MDGWIYYYYIRYKRARGKVKPISDFPAEWSFAVGRNLPNDDRTSQNIKADNIAYI